MIKSKILIFSILLHSVIFITRSHASDLRFYHLNTTHGLSQNTINFIHQDKLGFFWFGTNGGLNRWNGYDFTTYTHSPTDTMSMGQGRVNCAYEDNNGTLWFGTLQGGVSKFEAENNSFTNYKLHRKSADNQLAISSNQINSFNQSIIVGTFKHGLYTLNIITSDFTKVKLINQHNQILHNLSINKLFIDKDSTLWIAHNEGVLKIPNQKLNRNNPILRGKEFLKGERILCIYRDSRDYIWFGSHQSGGFYMDMKQMKIIPFKEVSSLKNYDYPIIRDFKEDKDQNLWIATGGNGINIIDSDFNLINHYENELNNNYSLSSNISYCLYLDHNKNMWVGTYNGGLNYTNNHKQSFNHIRGSGGKHELNNNAILSMCELHNGEIMIGTDGDGISFFNPARGTFTPFHAFNNYDDNTKNVAVSMARDNIGNVYIGTYLKGLFIYNEFNKKLVNIKEGSKAYNLPSNDIWAIHVNSDNTVWIGTLGGGISKYNPRSGAFTNYISNPNLPNSLCDNFTSCFLLDSKGQLWVGTENGGISVLTDPKKGIFKNFAKGDGSGLSSNEIRRIYEDSKNNIWISTHDGGLCLYNDETYSFKSLLKSDGLLSNSTRSIIEDNQGEIWVGSTKGVSVLSVKGDGITVSNFTQNNGLQGNEFNSNAILKTKNNFICMGGNNGINHFHPDSIQLSNEVGPIVITKVETRFHQDLSEINHSIISNKNQEKATEFAYDLALISFEYALLDYIVPELNRYKYILEGYDKQWINAGLNRKATYTNLDPGNYTFRVKGTNGLGIENTVEEKFIIIIHPPFWKELWFILASIAMLVLFIYLFVRKKINDYKVQEAFLIQNVDLRTKELLDVNAVLKERNSEINLQSEELKTKSEHLVEANDKLGNSYEKIEKQNNELEEHRNNLELLVKKRTQQLENAKLKAEESERLKMAFLANMSHEIRTPMNAIMGFSSLLAEEDFPVNERKEFSSLINSNSKSLMLLIDDILDLSKIEANQLNIHKSTFDCIPLFQETVANWKIINQENLDVTFIFENNIDAEKLMIFSDNIRLKQIINNLIDNAFKFTCVGSVQLKTWTEGTKLFFSVEDSGMGISDEELPKIFDRFRKSDDYTSKEFRGAGLGLTISKKLANLLDGELLVDSEFGKGTVFYLVLPLQ